MKSFLTLFKMELLAWLRVKINLFWIIAWPILWLIMMGMVMPVADKWQSKDFLQYYFPSCMGLVLLSSMISLSIRIAIKKEAGILQRLKVVPFPLRNYFIVQFLCSITMSIIGLLGISIIAVILKMETKGSLLALLTVFLLGSITFSSAGLFIAGRVRTIASANIFSMLTMFVLMFFSDMFIPLSDIQSTIYKISFILPASPFLALTRGIMISGDSLCDFQKELTVIVSWGIACIIMSFFTFKFDSK